MADEFQVGRAALSIDRLQQAFGQRVVLSDISLTLAPGEFLGVVGKSGCGKSTLLRLIAGLERPTAGTITHASTQTTRLLFQEARLLPWKRVWENVVLGRRGLVARQQADDALAQVGLAERGGDWPSVLSGGQRQRVALARALASRPTLLLLDEPLGALDALTRLEMQHLIERLQAEQGFTAVLVTHDIEEAVALCDRVVLLEEGTITAEVTVSLPRPRARSTTAFVAMKTELLDRLVHTPPTFEI